VILRQPLVHRRRQQILGVTIPTWINRLMGHFPAGDSSYADFTYKSMQRKSDRLLEPFRLLGFPGKIGLRVEGDFISQAGHFVSPLCSPLCAQSGQPLDNRFGDACRGAEVVAFSIRRAESGSPRCSSIMTPAMIIAAGVTIPKPDKPSVSCE
jgi:hypothetical protein